MGIRRESVGRTRDSPRAESDRPKERRRRACLAREANRLRDAFDAYVDACDETDAAQDEEDGPGTNGQDPPEHLRTRAGRPKAIRKAKERRGADARERAAREQDTRREAATWEGRTFRLRPTRPTYRRC